MHRGVIALLSGALASVAIPVSAASDFNYAYERSVEFDIKPQALSSALIRFGQQAELTILLPKSYVAQHKAPAVQGRIPLREALELLLSGAKLGYQFIDRTTLSIGPQYFSQQPSAVSEELESAEPLWQPGPRMVMEEVIITSQRRSQNVQNTPLAVSVLGEEKLLASGITSLDGVGSRVPGLTVSYFNLGQPTMHVRGIGSNDDGAALDSSVVVYLDDIYIGRISGIDMLLLDVERVEVLRGPQGTLYGRNTIGGAVNVIRNRATSEPSLDVTASLGNYDYQALGLVANGPLYGDSWLGRLAVSGSRIGGWQENIVTGTEQQGKDNHSAHAGFIYAPESSLSLELDLDYSKDNLQPTGRIPVASRVPVRLLDDEGNYIPVLDAGGSPVLGEDGTPQLELALPVDIFASLGGNPRRAANGLEGYTDREIWGLRSKLVWEMDQGSLSYISGYRRSDFEWLEDSTGLPNFVTDQTTSSLVNEKHKQFSQELRWASNLESRLSYVLGWYYLYENTRRQEYFGFDTGAGITDQNNTTNSYAVFGQADYSLTSDLTLSFGSRYTSDRKHLDQRSEKGGASAIILEDFELSRRDSWDDVSPMLALSWQASSDLMLYGSLVRGFKSGGFQGAPGTLDLARREIDPEQVWNFELGVKSEWLDNRLRFNLAAFYSDFSDLQVVQFRTRDNFGVFETSNAASATLTGVETELVALITPQLSLSGSYAWLDATYDDFADVNGRDFTGNRLRQAPEHSLSLSLNYRYAHAWGTFQAGLDYRYQSESFREPDNSTTKQPAYELMDVQFSFTSADGSWEGALWSRNVLDEEYISHLYVLGGNDYALFGQPRTYGITLTRYYR